MSYDAFSERKSLGDIIARPDGGPTIVDMTPDRVLELVVRSRSDEDLASWKIGELRGIGPKNTNVALRNVEVFGTNRFRFVNYPEGPYQVVVVAGKARVRASFDGGLREESIVIRL